MGRCFWIFLIPSLLFSELKFLHLSFHKTCLEELIYVAKELGISLESKEMLSCPTSEYDGIDPPWSALRYAISEEKANAIWKANEEYFSSFDGYIVSDTAPLSRIFYQNAKGKPLIVWICNRFDFWFNGQYPDPSYYEMFQELAKSKDVTLIAWSPYEITHCKHRVNVDVPFLIKPIGHLPPSIHHPLFTKIPDTVDKKNSLFLRFYGNEKSLGVSNILQQFKIPHYHGYYAGPSDLLGFKGVIHIPLATSNFFLFESFALGLPTFLPTKAFYKDLSRDPRFLLKLWCKPTTLPAYNDLFNYSEWYLTEHKPLFIFFDSWQDLERKIQKTDYGLYKRRLDAFSKAHKERCLRSWEAIFSNIRRSIR